MLHSKKITTFFSKYERKNQKYNHIISKLYFINLYALHEKYSYGLQEENMLYWKTKVKIFFRFLALSFIFYQLCLI